MKLLRTKIWKWYDIGLLKWSVLLFGMIVGAYFHDFVMQHVRGKARTSPGIRLVMKLKVRARYGSPNTTVPSRFFTVDLYPYPVEIGVPANGCGLFRPLK